MMASIDCGDRAGQPARGEDVLFDLREFRLPDGRELLLYGHAPHVGEARDSLPPAPASGGAHLRWHPLRREWVAYAGARQGRTFLPSAAACPLCPAAEGRLGEIPFDRFEIAVFENRFPAFTAGAVPPAEISGVETAPAQGRCEVVVFSDDHHAGLGTLCEDRLALLLDVWGARVRALGETYPYIFPFENRGEEIGVTLHHPHGQIYAFSFIPAQVRRAAEAQAEAPVIERLLRDAGNLVIEEAEAAVALVPPFAVYPYETWIVPRRRVAGPQALDDAERQAMAGLLGRAVRRLDGLFGSPMPYILTVQCAPRGFEATFHMTIDIRPLRRDAGKLKYLAGVEQGTGVFLADVLPEDAAARLRAVPAGETP